MEKKIIIIGGPTAGGKSKFALKLARKMGTVIINADSQQVYRELPILTAHPKEEEKKEVPHFLYGFLSVREKFSAGIWLENAIRNINEAHAKNLTPILVGGTGLYLKSLMHGIASIPDIEDEVRENARKLLKEIGSKAMHAMLQKRDPETAAKLKEKDGQRIVRAWEVIEQTGKSISSWQKQPVETFYGKSQFEGYFINPPRNELYKKCDKRFEEMINEGALEEAKKIIEMNLSSELPGMHALGLSELILFLREELTLANAVEKAQQATRNYAKRQVTWFRHQLPELTEI